MNLELLRQKVNIYRIMFRNNGIGERSIGCYMEQDDTLKSIKSVRFEIVDGKYRIIFK